MGSDTSYVHGGLTAGTAYYYAIVPINGLGAAALSNEVSGTPSAFAGCTTSGTLTDTDSDLLVHYGFNNNLNDVKNSNGDGRYNLVNTGGEERSSLPKAVAMEMLATLTLPRAMPTTTTLSVTTSQH